MAIEHYAFEVGEFEAVSADPREFEPIIWNRIYQKWPMVQTMREPPARVNVRKTPTKPFLLYRIVGIYAEPNKIDVLAFICVFDKDAAAALKLIIG
ncbi:MAG: hypothetical protein EOP83_06190 [Verrucomicrobiaceae bacterium]|nr:MAG: hypothetical protein EOP83_06190 [Verrucomicrobiaceae bacterium]